MKDTRGKLAVEIRTATEHLNTLIRSAHEAGLRVDIEVDRPSIFRFGVAGEPEQVKTATFLPLGL